MISKPKWTELLAGSAVTIFMLATAYFMLDMVWIAQPINLMAAFLASLFSGS